MFEELVHDQFYEEFKKYDQCVIDYCILKSKEYEGETTHKNAALFFMNKLYNEFPEEFDNHWMDEEKLKVENHNIHDLFYVPENYKELESRIDTNDYHRPYWFLFMCPPYGTNYSVDDFYKINHKLFPKGKDDLEIYDWSVDWATYFKPGLEWWGARCISIYDKQTERFILIFASATD